MSDRGRDRIVEDIWLGLENIPFDEDDEGEVVIAQDYHLFKKGTERSDIWGWFDKNHSRGVRYLLYEYKA